MFCGSVGIIKSTKIGSLTMVNILMEHIHNLLAIHMGRKLNAHIRQEAKTAFDIMTSLTPFVNLLIAFFCQCESKGEICDIVFAR